MSKLIYSNGKWITFFYFVVGKVFSVHCHCFVNLFFVLLTLFANHLIAVLLAHGVGCALKRVFILFCSLNCSEKRLCFTWHKLDSFVHVYFIQFWFFCATPLSCPTVFPCINVCRCFVECLCGTQGNWKQFSLQSLLLWHYHYYLKSRMCLDVIFSLRCQNRNH